MDFYQNPFGLEEYLFIIKTGFLDNAIQDFFIGLAIVVYEPIYHNLQIWYKQYASAEI